MLCSLSTIFFTTSVTAAAYGVGTYKVSTTSGANLIVRSGAGTNHSQIGSTPNNTAFEVSKLSGDWGFVDSKGGWVLLDYAIFQTPITGSADIADGWYKIHSILDTSKIWDIQYASGSNGGKLTICSENGNNNQIFYIEKLSDGSYRIKAKHSGLYIEISNSSTSAGGIAQQWQWEDGYFCKHFYIVKNSRGYIFRNKNSGQALDVYGAKTADGSSIVQWPYDPQDLAQIFTLTPVSDNSKQTMTNALYKINGSTSYLTCNFDGYAKQNGRHEGIDFAYGISKPVYSLTDGVITRVTLGATGSSGLSTIAIYNSATNKTIIYLHTAPLSSLSVGQRISKGQQIAVESWRGVSKSSSAHTHVEVRDGKRTAAAKSVNDSTLDNSNPKDFWISQGYEVK